MDEQKKDRSVPLIIFLISQIFLIIILVAIIFLNRSSSEILSTDYESQPSVAIEEFNNELPDSSSLYLGLIERSLLKTIELNSDSFNINNSKAEIRDGTLVTQKFDDIDGTYFSMIVDIPTLEQSYQIYALAPMEGNKDPNILSYYTQYILCLDDYAEKIYSNFQCEDEHPVDTRTGIVVSYLKYFDFDHFNAFVDSSNPSVINISTGSLDSIDEKTGNIYIQEVRDAVASLGISPDIFEYRVMQPEDYTYFISQ